MKKLIVLIALSFTSTAFAQNDIAKYTCNGACPSIQSTEHDAKGKTRVAGIQRNVKLKIEGNSANACVGFGSTAAEAAKNLNSLFQSKVNTACAQCSFSRSTCSGPGIDSKGAPASVSRFFTAPSNHGAVDGLSEGAKSANGE